VEQQWKRKEDHRWEGKEEIEKQMEEVQEVKECYFLVAWLVVQVVKDCYFLVALLVVQEAMECYFLAALLVVQEEDWRMVA
jgi:hypothetical protein